jgi:hypothetical protein
MAASPLLWLEYTCEMTIFTGTPRADELGGVHTATRVVAYVLAGGMHGRRPRGCMPLTVAPDDKLDQCPLRVHLAG